MTYKLPLWDFEGEGITEVKDEGLEEKEKKVFWKMCPSGDLNHCLLRERQEWWPLRHQDIKVRTFWEAHIIWKNLPHDFDVY